MPHVLVHAAAIDDLAADPKRLPGPIGEALTTHRPYARFGAVLADLPWYALPWRVLLDVATRRPPSPPPFATLLHNGSPVALGLRIAELAQGASLVGQRAGLALVGGYFSHLALDRTFGPPMAELARSLQVPGEPLQATARRIEHVQALLYLQRREGREIAGWSGIAERLQILQRKGFPFRGVGRGLHLLVATACRDVLGLGPSKSELDRWVRGLSLYARALGSPLGRRLVVREDPASLRTRVYEGEGFDFLGLYAASLERARHHVTRACAYLADADFGRSARAHVLEDIPEGAAG